MRYEWAIDGVPLADVGWVVERAAAYPAPARPRVSLLDVPGRDGPLATAQGYGPARASITIATLEKDAARLRLILSRARVLERTPIVNGRKQAAMSNRVLDVDITEPVPLGHDTAGNWTRYTAVFTLEPFWQAQSDTQNVTGLSAQAGRVTLASFAGSTAPPSRVFVCISGPVTRFRLVDPTTDTWIESTLNCPNGSWLYIDPAKGRTWVSETAALFPPKGAAFAKWGREGLPQFWPTPTTAGGQATTKLEIGFERQSTASANSFYFRGRPTYL